ncbi:MAG: hypothetical protein DSY66_04675 [Persephonella sp.]|nr:MAG: hypothetical protein DSY53_04765 [Persephonella sp.]RUM60249.1 MAG: hypothetical protein DSY66_04675 [Persephonella sp.]
MDTATLFLGIIALCMMVIAGGMLVVSIVALLALKQVIQLLIKVNADYKALSPKVYRILENLEYSTSVFGLLSLISGRRKK